MYLQISNMLLWFPYTAHSETSLHPCFAPVAFSLSKYMSYFCLSFSLILISVVFLGLPLSVVSHLLVCTHTHTLKKNLLFPFSYSFPKVLNKISPCELLFLIVFSSALLFLPPFLTYSIALRRGSK